MSLAIVPFGAGLIQLLLLAATLRPAPRSRATLAFELYLVGLTLWSAGSFVLRAGLAGRYALRIAEMEGLGLLLVPLALLYLSEAATGGSFRVKRMLAAGGLFVLLATLLLRGLFLAEVQPADGVVVYHYHPAVWWALLYSVILSGLAVVNLAIRQREEHDPDQQTRLYLLLIGVAAASLATLLNLLPRLQAWPFSLIVHTLNVLGLGWALLGSRIPGHGAGLRLLITRLFFLAGFSGAFLLMLQLHRLLQGHTQENLATIVPVSLGALIAVAVHMQWPSLQAWLGRLLFPRYYRSRRQLVALGRSITSILDLDLLTRVILDQAVEMLGSSRACLLLRDDRSGDYVVASERALAPPARSIRLRRDHPVVTWLAATLQPLSYRALARSQRFRGLWERERLDLQLLQGELFVPLNINSNVVGILVVGPKGSMEPYAPHDYDALITLANQTAAAVANARLLQQAQEHVAELTTLQEMGMKLSASLDLPTVLQEVVDAALKLSHADQTSLYLAECPHGRFRFGAGSQASGEQVANVPGPEQLVLTVAEQARPIIIHDVSSHPLVADGAMQSLGAMAGIPLKRTRHVMGVLTLRYDAPHIFDEGELRILSVLADQAAMAMENARLYQETVAQKRRTETILEQTSGGIMLIDPQYRITVINPALETITGYSAAEITGQPLQDVFDEVTWNGQSLLQLAASTGARVGPSETVLHGANGARDVLQGVMPLWDSRERVIGYLLSFADITHLKEVDRLKSDIVANVSHELRAPLASIKAYTELLLDGLESDSAELRGEFLQIIDRETDRLTGLISDLLDLSRLESGRFEVRPKRLRLSDLVEEAQRLFTFQVETRSLQVVTEFPPDGGELQADHDMLLMIVKNLLSNALKYSHPGGTIHVRAAYHDHELELDVADQGIGIPAEAIPHLFQKFYRVQSTTDSGIEGSGLGLVLVKQATEAHGGSVEVESTLGQGTTFKIHLPADL